MLELNQIYYGDCKEFLLDIPSESVDACVTDPPYELGFMNKEWDKTGISCNVDMWKEVLRVLKPGGYLLSFGGSRTYHRMACAIEDAGFEVRGMIEWIYGSGFPKNLNISKKIDLKEKNKWINISKSLDNLDINIILQSWIEYLKNAKSVGVQFQKSEIGIGISTQKNDSVLVSVLLSINHGNSNVSAIIAELNLNEAQLLSEASIPSVQDNAEVIMGQSQNPVKFAGKLSENPDAMQSIITFTVQCDVRELLNEKTEEITKVVEALMIWLGRTKSLEKRGTIALCAALTENLKLIILNQSKTFQSLDTIQQMEFVSAMTATITESTAVNLISFTANILKNKAIDKVVGAERKVVGQRQDILQKQAKDLARGKRKIVDSLNAGAPDRNNGFVIASADITEPATDAAKEWEGWGNSLKPAHEPVCFARKPLSEKTVAENVVKWGTGGISIHESRIIPYKMGRLFDYAKKIGECVVSVIGDNKSYIIQKHNGSCFARNYDKLHSFLVGDSYLLVDDEELNEQTPSYQKLLDFLGGCPSCFCLCDALVHLLAVGGLISARQLSDAHKHIHLFEQIGGLVVSPLHTREKQFSHLSNYDCSQKIESLFDNQSYLEQEYYIYEEYLKLFLESNHTCLQDKSNQTDYHVDILRILFFQQLNRIYNCDGFSCSLLKYLVIINITNTTPLVKKKVLENSRFPADLIHDGSEEVLRIFPITENNFRKSKGNGAGAGMFGVSGGTTRGQDDSGSAARFFYCAKSSKSERGEGNTHPTVKPIALMEYLIKLVTREGYVVLDPMSGSGTTALACINTGRNYVCIENDFDYWLQSTERVEAHLNMRMGNKT